MEKCRRLPAAIAYFAQPWFFSSRAKYSGANGRGSTSANGARSKCDFSAQGTVQSKMVLQLMPFPRIDGLYSGVWTDPAGDRECRGLS